MESLSAATAKTVWTPWYDEGGVLLAFRSQSLLLSVLGIPVPPPPACFPRGVRGPRELVPRARAAARRGGLWRAPFRIRLYCLHFVSPLLTHSQLRSRFPFTNTCVTEIVRKDKTQRLRGQQPCSWPPCAVAAV